MRRQLVSASFALAFLLALAGCGNPETLPPTPPPTPASSAPPAIASVSASVKIVPADVAHLAFVLSAPVKDVLVNEGDAVRSGDALIALDAPERSYAVLAAQQALMSAEADESIQEQGRRKWNGTKFVWLSGPPEQRRLAHARTLQAQASLVAAEAEMAQATLTAPFDGTVVAIEVTKGEVVQSGEVALVIANLDHLRAETTDLSEREIARVELGQSALLRLKAFSIAMQGRVSAIMPMAGKSPDGDTVYKVTIELNQQPAELLWGMTGEAELDTSH